MKKYQQILVMGAGAVGGYFGGRLAKGGSAEVTLVARGAHLKAIQKNGLQLKSIEGNATVKVKAFEDSAKAPDPDLILFTVKSYDTQQAIEQIAPLVKSHTQVLTIQNGIENYPRLVEAFGEERVIQGFCKVGASRPAPGIIEHKAFGAITVGEKNGLISPRLKALQAVCKEAAIPLHITAEIDHRVWLKFAWNSVFNMMTGVAGVTVEKLFEHEETEQLCHHLFKEIREVATMEGIKLTAKDQQQIIEPARKLQGFATSTYQDRMQGKKLEYEAFTGAIVRLADKHHIEIPHTRTLYALLKLIDIRE